MADSNLAATGTTVEGMDATFRKIGLRLIPFLFLLYIVAFLDRVNVGYAKLQMSADLHFSDEVYGLGAGIFFVGYFLFEVPSNLVLARIGARIWIARILIVWGLISAGFMFVQTPTAVLRHAFPAGCGGGRVLPGRHPVPDVLVPVSIPRAGDHDVHDRNCPGRHHRRPDLGLDHARLGGCVRSVRLAVGVPGRGCAGCAARLRDPGLSGQQPGERSAGSCRRSSL